MIEKGNLLRRMAVFMLCIAVTTVTAMTAAGCGVVVPAETTAPAGQVQAGPEAEQEQPETVSDDDSEEMMEMVIPTAQLVMEVNGKIYYPEPADNPSAAAFLKKLEEGKLTVSLHDYGNFEKVGPLPWELVRSDEQITTQPGDIILYQGNQITVYYDENTWNFTRLARINNVTREDLLEVLGDGDAEVSFWLEWSE